MPDLASASVTTSKIDGVWSSIKRLPHVIGRPPGGIAYIPQVDGLRFLAIFTVMIWHASLRAGRYAHGVTLSGTPVTSWYAYFPRGEIGVDLFFFISAFVITQLFRSRRDHELSILTFYKRRARRIYPPYLVILLCCFLILYAFDVTPKDAATVATSTVGLVPSFAASLLYLHGILFASAPRLNPPMWSLEIEIQFYLVAPLLWTALSRLGDRRNRIIALIVALAAFTVIPGVVETYLAFDERFRWGLFTHGFLFIAGALAAELDLGRVSDDAASNGFLYDALLGVGLILLLAIGEYLTVVDGVAPAGWPNIITNLLVLFSLFAIFLGAHRGRAGRFVFGLPWLALIGTMCYSIYLTHIIIMQGVSDKLLSHLHLSSPFVIWPLWFAILLPIAIIVGGIFYICVERPFMSKRRVVRTPA